MNRSQIIYRVWKTVLLLVSGAVLSSGVAWAQSADDVDVKVETKDARCIQDGEVSINVSKKIGSPYDFALDKVSYDLRDDKGNSLAGASGQFVLNNRFGGLKKGVYKAYAKVRFNNDVEVTVGPFPAVVNSDYKIPTVAIKLERKTLKNYKENGQRVPTGIISVMVTGGNRPEYRVKMIETPPNYTGIKEHVLTPDVKIYFYNLLEGTYKFQVYDQCGGQEVQTIEMQTVAFDTPQRGVVPFETNPQASEETRLACGWFFFRYQNRGVAQFVGNDQDLQPYLSPTDNNLSTQGGTVVPLDTIAKYYNYAFAYGDAKPTKYYKVGEVPFNGSATPGMAADYGTMYQLFTRILNGKKWSEAGFVDTNQKPEVSTIDKNVFPALFLQVKGSSDEMPTGFRGKRIKTKKYEFLTHWITLVDPCRTDYYVNIRPSEIPTELFCYPIKVGLFDTNKTTRLGTVEDVVFTRKGSPSSTRFGDYVLKAGKDYWIKGEDGSGAKVEFSIRIEDSFTYNARVNPSRDKYDICNRKRGSAIEIYRATPIGATFLKHKVTLESAPAGYEPEEEGLALGEMFEFPADFPSGEPEDKDRRNNRFFPFGKKSELFRKSRDIFAPNGKYIFKIEDACGKIHMVEAEITTAMTPKWTVVEENFKPRLVNASCGRVRIYPFRRENKTNFLFKSEFWDVLPNGKKEYVKGPVPYPMDLMIYIDKFPTGLSKQDVTHNFPSGSTWVWSYYTAMWWVSASEADHYENLFIELPKTNGEIVLKVAPFSRSIEYDKVFKELECMPSYPINLSNIPLSYERETYIGYSCPDGLTGRLFIVPTNNVGGVKIELFYEGDPNPFATETLAKDQVKNGASFSLTAPSGKKLPGKLRAKLTDMECSNYNDESLIIYNLPSPDMIRTPNQQRKYCVGDNIELAVINLGNEVTFSWKLPNGEIRSGQKITLTNVDETYSGEYEITINNILCGGASSSISQKFVLSVAPRELWWRKDAQDADWHNLDNWAKKDGTTVRAVPAPCTTVHIPASVDKAFPDLAGGITNRNIYGTPECHDIYFHYGSQLGTPQQLSYNDAYVDYNFGQMDQNTGNAVAYKEQGHPSADSRLMERNRWYMIATPLKNMVSGDFGVGGYPKTFQRYLKVSSQASLTDASFTKPFNSQVEPLGKYNNAMALRVAGYQSGKKGYDSHSRLNMLDGIIRLPFFRNPRSISAYEHHRYDDNTDISTFRYYNENTLALTNRTDSYKRILPDAFRFVFETNNPGRQGKIGSILVSGVNTEGYSLGAKPTGGVGDWIMLGNPFMTPMDFDKFYEVNQDKIEPYYYLFTENVWKVYSKATAPASTLSKEIAPLQSIVVKRKVAGDLLFPTSGDKSVLLPSWRTDQPDRYEVKNTGVVSMAETPLTINVANREGDYSQAFLGWSDEVSAPVFVNSEYASMPTVFLVEPDAGDYNAITYPKRAHGTINLGVASSLSSPLTLSFDHIDRSVYEELTLVDKHEGVEQDLLSNPQYDFIHKPDTTPATRFALRIKRFGITNVTSSDEMPIAEFKMFYRAGSLRVESPDALHRVVVYDMQGKTLADEVLTDNATRTVEVDTNNAHGVVVVEVFFKNGMRTVRKYDLR